MQIHYHQLLLVGNYLQIIQLSKKAIEEGIEVDEDYWYLGLANILVGDENKAKILWSLGRKNYDNSHVSFTTNLIAFLIKESIRQEDLNEYQIALTIRYQVRDLSPHNFDNLVQIVYLLLNLNIFTFDALNDLNLTKLDINSISSNLLLQLTQNVLYSPLPELQSLGFVFSFLPNIVNKKNLNAVIDILLFFALKKSFDTALEIINTCLSYNPKGLQIHACLIKIYTSNQQFLKAIETARSFISMTEDLTEQIVSTHLLLEAVMSAGGNWQEAEIIYENYKSLILSILDQNPSEIPKLTSSYLCISGFYAPYFEDTPQANLSLRGRVLSLLQTNAQNSHSESVRKYKDSHCLRKQKNNFNQRKLKVGYLSTSLRQHSIGWLSRSLFEYHNHDLFDIYGYFPQYQIQDDFLQDWYVGKMDKIFREGVEYWGNSLKVADKINDDEIDILIDLESITTGICCDILALKPAPVQVTWLGWDASELPSIDYYIADSYVLPEDAQNYYSEKIWRLPQTYVAVEGFNYTIASIHREDFDISQDAIIFFSSQKSYKRHPDTVRSQIQIIKQVPNSYFLIKGLADDGAIQTFFHEIAESEGLERDRLKFLPFVQSEPEHRANLAIADVVLDTYPYNGATTTMETLWMGIPMVTRVGEQFASRNSYGMMMNAGITEGIAWTNEQYIEWGIRFGTDSNLRKEVAWKLRQSRKTSPLWNGKQFAKEMEKAYEEMWEIYIKSKIV